MKPYMTCFVLTVMAIVAIGCGQKGEEVRFPDAKLEAAIRKTLKKPKGRIHESDLRRLTKLDAYTEDISDLSGMERCTNLRELHLYANRECDLSVLSSLRCLTELDLRSSQIRDIGSLSGLTWLEDLSLYSEEAADITAIENLTNLQELGLYGDGITDISAVRKLAKLAGLFLNGEVSDISPLSELGELRWIVLSHNLIEDLTPLSQLHKLFLIGLNDNRITDVGPLVRNPAIREGVQIHLTGNPLSEESVNDLIPQLEQRGVKVFYDKPKGGLEQ